MISYFGDSLYGGERYDYEDTPDYLAQREIERKIIEEDLERRLRYGD